MARPKKPKPKTEIELGLMQDLYLTDKDKYQNEYILMLKPYARSLALKEIKGKVVLPPDRVEEVALEATLKLLKQYEKNSEWKVWASFGGALRWKVIESLYENSKEESCLSLNTLIGADQSRSVEDMVVQLGMAPLYVDLNATPETLLFKDYDTVISEVDALLEEASGVLSYKYMLVFKLYLNLLIRRPKIKNAMQNFKQTFVTSKMEEIFDTLLLEIRNRLLIED